MTRVLVWNEYVHERENEAVRRIYPKGIHGCLADCLGGMEVKTATLEDEACGLSEAALEGTDVLIWWGHMLHGAVPDETALRVRDAVRRGMGIVFLHSSHRSKPFQALLGTSGNLSWRESGDLERIWVSAPAHPIARGLGRYFELPHEEMYGEPFDIPEPDKVVFHA